MVTLIICTKIGKQIRLDKSVRGNTCIHGIKEVYSTLTCSIHIKMAEGINDFLNRFLLASGTFRRLPYRSF